MLTRFRDEDGFALITAVMVSLVVMFLGLAALQLSLHNSDASGYDRKRVQSIDAAEAGIDYYYSYLQATGGASPSCSVTKSLTSSPAASFTVTATFYNSSNGLLSCSGGSLPSGVTPATVLIRSVGKSVAATPSRTMESYAKLTPTQGSTFDNSSAIFGQNSISFTANATIGGSQYNDADIYSPGNISLAANSILYGSLYGQGSVTMGSNSDIQKDVWANGSLTMNSGARVRGNATSSTSSITLGNNARVYGNAKAGTTNTGGTVDGYRTSNSPSGAPPTRTYPTFTYNSTDWTGAGYTIHTYSDCSTLLGATPSLANWWGGADGSKHLVRVTGNCTISSSSAINVRGDLAFIVDGNISLTTNTRFVPAGTAQQPFNLFFVGGLADQSGCSFTANPNSGVNGGINTMIYVPSAPISCTVNLNSNSTLAQGQVLGGTVNFQHTASFTYARLTIPGTGSGGFKEDVRCLREVVNGSALPAAPAC